METLLESGEVVGRLPEPQLQTDEGSNDNQEEEEEPYVVFLSHTGRDKAKEELARPTYFLLNTILKVKTFIDDGEMAWGSETDTGLATPAYQCTHAVVILSPSFRKRWYCVKELNTFLHRFHQSRSAQEEDGEHQDTTQRGTIKLLPALWKLANLNDYPEELQRISWAAHHTDNAVYYMLKTLWPRLIKSLGLPPKSERKLREHFFTYVDHQLGSPRQVPIDFLTYAKDHGCRLLFPQQETPERSSDHLRVPPLSPVSTTSSEADSSSEEESHDNCSVIVGVSFFNVDMDHKRAWNRNVLQRKESIEEKLAIIAKYGEVVYGRTIMSTNRRHLLGAAVARLECEIELDGNLSKKDYNLAKSAAVGIGNLLKGAGTTEEELNQIMIGTFWRGSLLLLLEAPELVLERLYNVVARIEEKVWSLGNKNELKVTGMTPAFTIRVQTTGGPASSFLSNTSQETQSDVVLWRDETAVADLNLLLPVSLEARGKLLACGVPYTEWLGDSLEDWKSMATTFSSCQAHDPDAVSMLRDQGKLKEVEPLFQFSLGVRQSALGREHQATLATLNNLVMLLQEQGKPGEAKLLLQEQNNSKSSVSLPFEAPTEELDIPRRNTEHVVGAQAMQSFSEVEASGVAVDPLDFPPPRVHVGVRASGLVVDPRTGSRQVCTGVIHREDLTDASDLPHPLPPVQPIDEENSPRTEEVLAYWPQRRLQDAVYGAVWVCLVLKIHHGVAADVAAQKAGMQLGSPTAPIVWEITGQHVAIKMVSWAKVHQTRGRLVEDPLKEVAAMQLLGLQHQTQTSTFVLGSTEVLQDGDFLYSVMPYCRDGDLFGMVVQYTEESGGEIGMPEPVARHWFRQILWGLHHLQLQGIFHHDLCLENILVDGDVCMIFDFGMCLRVPYNDPANPAGAPTDVTRGSTRRLIRPQGVSGKKKQMSPEVFSNQDFDGFAADLWAAGVILYTMLTGFPPYDEPSRNDQRFDLIVSGRLVEQLRNWDIFLSHEAGDLLQKMLQMDPRERLTLSQVIEHPWVAQGEVQPPPPAEPLPTLLV